jgi:hypothetical protein
LNKRLEAFVN